MVSRIAIIPARGGSKRIPRKNVADFCGKPMIEYALTAAKESGLFDKIHVSTECGDISSAVENLGFEIDFHRPAELADDITPIMPVLKYVAETYKSMGLIFDQVFLVMATSPLIEASDLVGASALHDDHEGKFPVLGVVPYPVPIEWAYSLETGGMLKPLEPGQFAVRSQDLVERYYDAGSFAVFSGDDILNSEGAGDNSQFVGYKLAKYKGIDIDDVDDFSQAEMLYRGRGI